MSDAISAIGSAAVTTIGTVAVAKAGINAVSKATSGMNHGGGGGHKKKNYNVWNHGSKHSSKRKSSKSMLGF